MRRGVDDHERARRGLKLPDPVAHARRRHQTAVRSQRVAPKAQQELCAIYFRHREERLMAEQLVGRQRLRELVERGRVEAVAGPQRGDQGEDQQLCAE
jgi:hypothetical protein